MTLVIVALGWFTHELGILSAIIAHTIIDIVLLKKIEKQSVDTDNLKSEYYNPEEEEESIRDLKVDKLKEALEKISPEEKMILLLKYQDSLSIKDLTGVLDIGESAVKMRLKRAKDKLVNVYNNDHYGE